MGKFTFTGRWSSAIQKIASVPRGYLIIMYDDLSRGMLGKELLKLDAWQNKAQARLLETKPGATSEEIDECLREIIFTCEYHFKKRTLDQNALMWALYTVYANELNGGQSGAKEQMITPMELYIADLEEYGDDECVTTRAKNLAAYRERYRVIAGITLDDGREVSVDAFLQMRVPEENRITIRAKRGTSDMDTREMGQWIDRIFNALAYHGISVIQPEDIQRYWVRWREGLNDEKVILHDEIMRKEDYKALTPICEGCGGFVGHEGGQLAHIKGFGMGGDRTEEPAWNYTSNWLHLCTKCHMDIWHGLGVKAFLKKFKHLTYKVNTALFRDYAAIEGQIYEN